MLETRDGRLWWQFVITFREKIGMLFLVYASELSVVILTLNLGSINESLIFIGWCGGYVTENSKIPGHWKECVCNITDDRKEKDKHSIKTIHNITNTEQKKISRSIIIVLSSDTKLHSGKKNRFEGRATSGSRIAIVKWRSRSLGQWPRDGKWLLFTFIYVTIPYTLYLFVTIP